MSNQEAPKIEFPCPNYPVKVVGKGVPHYDQLVIDIVRKYAADMDVARIKYKDSSNGKFRSLTFYITATSAEQLAALHKDLTAKAEVHMVM